MFSLTTLSAITLPCLVLVSGCQQELADKEFEIVYDACDTIVVSPAEDSTPEELQSLDDALAMWNQTGVTRLTRQDRPDSPTIPLRFKSAALVFYGVYQDEIGDVIINRELRDRHARAVTIAHELGHALGLHHVRDEYSVMTTGNLQIGPTDFDVAEIDALWGPCPVSTDTVTVTVSGKR